MDVLELRRKMPGLLRNGGYAGLEASGERAEHILAYARQHQGAILVVVAGRLCARLLGEPGRLPLGNAVCSDTAVEVPELTDGAQLENALTGETLAVEGGRIRVAQAFASFPGAALLAANRPG